jgi:amino acid adenylation domain-containing protein
MNRNVDMIISMLAILKAGGAFLPVDPSLPIDRIEYMVNNADCSKILINNSTDKVLEKLDLNKINLDVNRTIISGQEDVNIDKNIDLDNLAYVIFTSGSTGMPKGTMLNHKGLSNLSAVQKDAFQISNGKKVMQFSSLSFDASVWETVMALLNGGSLYLTSQEVISSGYELSEYIDNNEITTITLPPSVLAVLPEKEYPKLQTLITAGEAISNEIVRKWNKTRSYFNAYGPTETTVCAAMLSPAREYPKGPPIGNSINNFETYILNEDLYPAGIGIPGELCIGGIGLARGYMNLPDLTAEKFIPHPFIGKKGERLYRTGDLARYLPDGTIEFLGRIDTQIKLRGFRIEIGEIEHSLSQVESVRDAAVILKKLSNNQEMLIGYVVCSEDEFNKESIKDQLKQKLPEYMVPSSIIRIDKMPLTTSGKVDKQNLPTPDITRDELGTEYVAPRNEDEEKLVSIVQELLSVNKVGVRDNFFELGGHSLLATQFVSRIKDELNKDIKLIKIFEEPTIEGVSKNLIDPESGETIKRPEIQKVSRESRRTKRSDLL